MHGFYAFSGAGVTATSMMLVRCLATNNDDGIRSQGLAATLRVAQSIISGNNYGWVAADGALFTFWYRTSELAARSEG
jgi:hypothetical protein